MLAPVQVVVLPITDDINKYAKKVQEKLSTQEIRTELDDSSSKISYKIRKAETMKIPYIAICGKWEAESETISVRRHGGQNLGIITIQELVKLLKNSPRYCC